MTELDPTLITPCGALTATTRGGPDYLGVAAEIRERHGADIRILTTDAGVRRLADGPVRPGRDDPVPAGRRALQPTPLRRPGHAVGTSQRRHDHPGHRPGPAERPPQGWMPSSTTAAGCRAETAIVATGAFAAGSDLLPVPVALRAKSEVYVMAELDDQQAAELDAMPCVNRTIHHPQLADLYVLPPIRYPDGRIYLKLGVNTTIDHWLPDPAAVHAWYDDGDDDGPLPAMRGVLTGLLPGVRVRAWHGRRCADAYTAHRRPYIDVLEPNRVIVALGGNGRGAQAADAIGRITAHLALTGEWASDLPRDAFRVPASATWNGMRLLRDQAI